MDALRINEPFGNNFRSRTASFKANRTNSGIHSHCFELSIARVTPFCPNYSIRLSERTLLFHATRVKPCNEVRPSND